MNAERFEELYEAYVDGSLDPAARAEFVKLLEDPEIRARFVELAAYETALAEEHAVAEPELLPSEDTPGASRKPASAGRRSSGRLPAVRVRRGASSRPIAPWQIALGVAALLLIGVVALVATGSRGGEPARRPVAPVAQQAQAPEPRSLEPLPLPKEVVRTPPRPVEVPLAPPVQPREVRSPAPLVVPVPKEEAPAAPKPPAPPPPKPESPRESVAFIAHIERSSDPSEAGRGVVSGQGLSTAPGRYLSVKFPDGTRLELGGDTVVARVAEGASGKSVQVERGLIAVEAAKQSAGKAVWVATPFAEATVLGTEFTLWTTPAYSRLDVMEGRVRFGRPGGATSLMVGAGHYAIAGQGFEFAAKPGPALWKAPAGGLILWLRADSGVKPGEWSDGSPAGNHATQPAAASQPLLVPNAAGTRPAFRFDGKDDYFALPDGFSDFKSGLTAFVVVRPAAGGAWTRFLDLDQGPQCDNIVFGRKDTPDKLGFWVYANNQTRSKIEAPGSVVADQLQSFGVVLALGGRATLYRNGAAVAAGQTSVPVNTLRKPNGIGKSSSGDPYFKGDLFEILLLNRALPDSERTYVEGYLNAKYFDPTAPPPLNRPLEK